MKKKEFLTEAKRKAIIADKEKAIIESFAKTFNKIKRLDENEISQFKVGDIVMWNPTFKMGKDYSVMYGAKAVVINVIGGSNQLEVEWIKEPSNLKLVNGQMDGNYNINYFELTNEAGVDKNDHEEFNQEDELTEYGLAGMPKNNFGGDSPYFETLSQALDVVREYATKLGYEVNEQDMWYQFGTGGIGYEESKSANIGLLKNGEPILDKRGKEMNRFIRVSIYRMPSGKYELTMYKTF